MPQNEIAVDADVRRQEPSGLSHAAVAEQSPGQLLASAFIEEGGRLPHTGAVVTLFPYVLEPNDGMSSLDEGRCKCTYIKSKGRPECGEVVKQFQHQLQTSNFLFNFGVDVEVEVNVFCFFLFSFSLFPCFFRFFYIFSLSLFSLLVPTSTSTSA